jgi:plastocyanin
MIKTAWRPAVILAGVAVALALPGVLGAQSDLGAVQGHVTMASGRALADVVVSLSAPGVTVTPPAAPVTMDQQGFEFRPHVLPIVRGTTVRFLNSDPEDHNVYSPEGGYNLGTWSPGQTRDQVFSRPGVYTQLCRVHQDMEGFIVVLDTPYFAVSDKSGVYTIRHVPPGTYTWATWGKRLRPVKQTITVAAGTALTVDLGLSRGSAGAAPEQQ